MLPSLWNCCDFCQQVHSPAMSLDSIPFSKLITVVTSRKPSETFAVLSCCLCPSFHCSSHTVDQMSLYKFVSRKTRTFLLSLMCRGWVNERPSFGNVFMHCALHTSCWTAHKVTFIVCAIYTKHWVSVLHGNSWFHLNPTWSLGL